MAQLNCQLQIPKPKDDSAPALTVGREFTLECEGEWPAMKTDSIELRLDQADRDKLKLLEFQFVSPTQGKLTVTSYKPGDHQLKAVQLVDPEHSVVLGDLQFQVASVINPQDPPAEPYGSFGPLPVSLPIYYALSVILLLAVIVFGWGYRFRRRAEKRRLLAEMRLDESAMDPLGQFFQAVRKLQRNFGFFAGIPAREGEKNQFVDEIDRAFKVYLARRLAVPTLEWADRKILADIQSNHPDFYQGFHQDLRRNLAELARAKADNARLSEKDCQQLVDLLRRQVDQMERFFRKGAET